MTPVKKEEKKPAPAAAASQTNLAEKQVLCDCLNRYLTGERTEEQRRSYNKWCTDKERWTCGSFKGASYVAR
jgi:hypothetical protein